VQSWSAVTDGLAEREQLELAIEAQERLRGTVADEVVDAVVATLRQRLNALMPDVERRRQVSVLFADVSGFTAMSSELDAEVVAGAMNEVWRRLDAVVSGHGGRVDKHIGDALMAVWGMSSTGEDDPEWAVRAGLAMHEALGEADVPARLAMRIGINTGPAHIGAVGARGEVTAMGDTVNVASRVEALAPVGGVLITHDTYRHIRGIFDVLAHDPVMVKGKAEPLRTYLVIRAKDRRFRMMTRGVEGVETRMVGRQREFIELQEEFDRTVDVPRARCGMVIGDAGIGKSRLLYEFENWIELHPTRTYFFKGRATATRQAVPFGLLRDLFADRFGILDTDPSSAVSAKVHDGTRPILTADEADVVGHWLGFDLRSSSAVRPLLGAGQLATAARAHFLRYIEQLTADEPAVMFLEDLHWADEESIDLIGDLLRDCPTAHLLVIAVGRPPLLERPETRPLLDASTLRLSLRPLDTESSRALVEEILQRTGGVPGVLADLIVDRADGNAYYIEELTKMLIDDGVIETGDPCSPPMCSSALPAPTRNSPA
jgi:class 3 adenylate cyclase